MDITQLLAALLNPNGQQQAILGPSSAPPAVGDHANPALLQAQTAQFARPMPSAPQMAPQQVQQPQAAPQAPQQPQMRQPMPQSAPPAPVAPQAPSGGGIGGFLESIVAPNRSARNKTASWLKTQGMDDVTATAVAADPQLLRSVMMQRMQGQKLSDFDQRASAADQYGLTEPEDRRKFILTGNLPEARGGAAEMSLNTIPVVVDGKAGLLQVDKAGKGHVTELPPGASIAKAPMIKDTGTEFQVIDPVTREVVQTIPKNVAAAAAQTKIGEAQGAAAFDLPRVEQNAQQTLDTIQTLKTHPGRETGTGLSATWDPRNYIAGTDATDFKVALNQAKGQTFLQAYQSLKGSGAITDIEGAKATAAIARLDTSQSDEEFNKALDDFKTVIETGLARAKQQAGTTATPAAAPSAPAKAPTVGENRYGYVFKGGDPSVPANWEKAN